MHCVVVIRRGGGRWKNGIVGIELNTHGTRQIIQIHQRNGGLIGCRCCCCCCFWRWGWRHVHYVDCAGSSPGMRWAIFTSKRNAKHRAVRKTFKWTQSASESEGMRCDGESIDWSSFVVPYWTLSVAEVLYVIKKWQRVTSFDGKINKKYYPVNYTRRLHDQVSALIKKLNHSQNV